MESTKLFLLIIAGLFGSALQANWAVVIAGSKGYDNYRHQADACHAYQTLLKGGIPASNIILLAFNDIANNLRNPLKGKMYNHPDGDDVYAGCKIDYEKYHVTPKNYINVITGNADAMKGIGSGRVLKSTKDDMVFLYFADHGAPGLIGFPSLNEVLNAKDLQNALQKMHDTAMYNKLMFYVEACESGSMFDGFATIPGIHAITAANPSESSWGNYCPPNDKIQGTDIHSCLGDTFSTNWMENTDSSDTTTETLQQQYEAVKQLTTKSHVMTYGDASFMNLPAATFLGKHPAGSKTSMPHTRSSSSWRVWDNRLNYLINLHSIEMSELTMDALNREILNRKNYDIVFGSVAAAFPNVPDAKTTDFECYTEVKNSFNKHCGVIENYGMKYYRLLYNLCAVDARVVQKVESIFAQECPEVLFTEDNRLV